MGGPYQSSTGRTVKVGPELGRGGEGIVYSVEGENDKAAKIYLPGLAAERRDKILAMVAAGWHRSAGFVAFPTEALFSTSGAFVGFTMRKVRGNKAVHELYSPTGRKSAFPTAGFPFLLRTAANVARAMAAVHATGCVVGDVNHSGVLIGQDATVTLIDSDSFQVAYKGGVFPCKVGVPEFTPPELQGKRLDQVHRSVSHDTFGLATLVFNLLFMGRHPFSGRYLGTEDMPLPKAIEEFRFAYSARRSATRMEPPPNVPTLTDVPLALSDAFEQAFGPSGASRGRPTAADWVGLLEQSEKELVRCPQNSGHHYFRVAHSCPWCRMEKAFPGFVAFATTQLPQPGGKPLDIGQLIAAIRSIPDPGPAPDLTSFLAAPSALQASASAVAARKQQVTRWALGALGAIIGLLILATNWIPSIIGLILLGGCGVWALTKPPASATVQASAAKAKADWLASADKYENAGGNHQFLKLRQDAEALIAQAQGLPAEEGRRIAGLDSKRRAAQMRQHLEKYPVAKSGVKGIGASRLLTLKSYGIESAADVDRRRIESIPMFGPSLANGLLEWRRKVEARFVFDPRQVGNPADVLAIKSDIARRGADLEKRIRQHLHDLQNIHASILATRSGHASLAQSAWEHWKQIEIDLQEVERSGQSFKKIIMLTLIAVIVGVFGWVVVSANRKTPEQVVNSSTAVPQTNPSLTSRAPEHTPNVSSPLTQDTSPLTPLLAAQGQLAQSSSPASPVTDRAPTKVDAPAAFTMPNLSAENSQPNASEVPSTAQTALPPLSAPFEIKPSPAIIPAQEVITAATPQLMNLLARDEATQIQSQLAWFGYFEGFVDGIWGPRSRSALRQFRRQNNLGLDDQWDLQTQSLLMSNSALKAAPNSTVQAGSWNGPEGTMTPPPGATLNPLNRADAAWVQDRLRQLGFYKLTNSEGVWGAGSRDALRDFKTLNNLAQDDTWDAATENALKYAHATRADQTFVGAWAIAPASCTASPGRIAPLTITSQRAEVSGGICTFDRWHSEGFDWRTRAECSEQGKNWSLDLRLRLVGRTLIWSNGEGTTTYYRC